MVSQSQESQGAVNSTKNVMTFCEITGADAETANHILDGAASRRLSFEAAMSFYYETVHVKADCAETPAALASSDVSPADDSLSGSELRARSLAASTLSEEDMGWLAYSTRNVMPHTNATWSWGKDSWGISLRAGLTTDSSFIPYSDNVTAQIEEHYSRWKQDTAPATCTLDVGECNNAGNTLGMMFAKQMGTQFAGRPLGTTFAKACKVVIDFEAMMQTDVLTRYRRPIRRTEGCTVDREACGI